MVATNVADITKKEVVEAVEGMKVGKVIGLDGVVVKSLKTRWSTADCMDDEAVECVFCVLFFAG